MQKIKYLLLVFKIIFGMYFKIQQFIQMDGQVTMVYRENVMCLHQVVNHSGNFVDPLTGVSTQRLESFKQTAYNNKIQLIPGEVYKYICICIYIIYIIAFVNRLIRLNSSRRRSSYSARFLLFVYIMLRNNKNGFSVNCH